MKFPREILFSFFIVIAAWAVVQYSLPLMPVDETRYTSVAWEMHINGHWLLPTINGEPYSHKGPLLFWLTLIGWKLFGVHQIVMRAIPLLFSMGSLLLTSRIARLLWPDDEKTHRYAPILLAGTGIWFLWSSLIMFDVLLTFWSLLGLWGVIAVVAAPSRGWQTGPLIAIALSVAGGLLTKGPVIFVHILPAVVLAFFWNPAQKPSAKAYLKIVIAMLAGAAIVLAWAIPAAIQGGSEYRHMIFVGQTADRVVTSFSHRRPIWWYLPYLPVFFFPWFVFKESWSGLARCKNDRGILLCLTWFISSFVIFSVISGKQIHYLIPEIPAAMLIFAKGLAVPGVWKKQRIYAIPIAYLAVAAAGYAVTFFNPGTDITKISPTAMTYIVLGMVASAMALGAAKFDRVSRMIPAVALSVVLAGAILMIAVKDTIREKYDLKSIAQKIGENPAAAVGHIGRYEQEYHFLGRITKPFAILKTKTDVARFIAEHPDGLIVSYAKSDQNTDSPEIRFQQSYRGKMKVLLWDVKNYRPLNETRPSKSDIPDSQDDR